MDSERLARIRPRMQAFVDSGKIPGICTLLAHKGQVIWSDQVGWQDKESALPLRADSIFRIYSMTKPVICTALMTLYEKGFFQLSDPISRYLPAFQSPRVLEVASDGRQVLVPAKREITIFDLCTHTSGLTYDFLEESPVGALYREAGLNNRADRTLAQLVETLATLPLAFHPGERWHYSLSMDVLARLIEVLSGKPLETFLTETLFAPLGMTHTAFHIAEAKRHRSVSVYGIRDFCDPKATHIQFRKGLLTEPMVKLDVSSTYPLNKPGHWARGGIGLFSTPGDFFRFAQMLLNGGALDGARILGHKTVDLMHQNHLPSHLLPFHISQLSFFHGYGFGFGSRVLMDVQATQMPGSVGEYGWYGAAKTYYWIDPKEQMIGILMAQVIMGPGKPEKEFQVLAYQSL
jgi:CubicO group peptidase (beta-lactamase class C family)